MSSKLGQNFLKNKEIAKKIVKAANLSAQDVVLEIGSGKGILTEELAKYAGKVVAIEIDKDLIKLLRNKLHNNKNVEFINEDILRVNLKNLLGYKISKYKVVANLPYYITSPVIRMFLESDFPPEEMILMVQKEVAERITAEPPQMSILSVSVQYYAKPELLFYVDKSNFSPAPEVDSAVLRISNFQFPISNPERNNFFRVVRSGFCAKRKTLVNNLVNSFHLDKRDVEEKIKKVRILPTSRAQELDIRKWKKLAEVFKTQ